MDFCKFCRRGSHKFQNSCGILGNAAYLGMRSLYIVFCGTPFTPLSIKFPHCHLYSVQASTQEGASKVYELLRGTAFRSIGWATLFDCIRIYDDKFKQSLQTAGTVMPDFLEGDAKALVSYLNVLQKVI